MTTEELSEKRAHAQRSTQNGLGSSFHLIPKTREPRHLRYGFALVCTLAAFLVRYSLDPFLKDHSPLLLFALAVAVSSIRGFGAGIFSTILGAFGALFFFPLVGSIFPIEREYLPTALFQLAIFLTTGFLLSYLGEELRRIRWRSLDLLRQRNDILDSITDGFGALDQECRIIYLNDRAALEAHGSAAAAVGRSVWQELPEWQSPGIRTQLLDVLNHRAAAHFEYLSDLSGRWFDFHVHPAAHGGLTVYFSDISDRKRVETELRETSSQRDSAVQQVRLLSGLLPICAACKKIRDKEGRWHALESYISAHSDARFSHGMCEECARRYWGDAF